MSSASASCRRRKMPKHKTMEKTFVMIKPDGVRRQLIASILARFTSAGLIITQLQLIKPNKEQATKHYEGLRTRGEGIMQRNVKTLCAGTVVIAILEGNNAVAKTRQLLGATEPLLAATGTIRGDWANDTILEATKENRGLENLAHASDSVENANVEEAILFK